MAKDKDFEKLGPDDRLGNEPIPAKFKELMTGLMKTIDGIFNGEDCLPGEKQTGVIMLLFPYNDAKGRVNYMSNGANRSDVCRIFEEQLIRFKTDRDDDAEVLERMAAGIANVYRRHKERPMLSDDEAAMAAAAMALTIYRKG